MEKDNARPDAKKRDVETERNLVRARAEGIQKEVIIRKYTFGMSLQYLKLDNNRLIVAPKKSKQNENEAIAIVGKQRSRR